MAKDTDTSDHNRPESPVQQLSAPEQSTTPPSPLENPCGEHGSPQLGTFVLDIYVPEVVLGKQVDVNDLPRHMIVRDPAVAAMLWVLLFMAKEDGMIETGSPVWVGREH